MSVSFFTLLFDFGMFVLIWIVQLIIYPSFLHFCSQNLLQWHNIYTKRFTIIVLPLMLGQLGCHSYSCLKEITFLNGINIFIVFVLWGLTFLIFIPLHSKIINGNTTKTTLESLVNKNWMRTILWSLLLCLSFTHFFMA